MQQERRSSPSIERVRAALAADGLAEVEVREFTASTATAVDAAAAIGTTVERIVKSLVFVAGDAPLLVLASGPNRVDTARVGELVGAEIRRATAAQVREWTGYAIGGVPPLGHPTPLRTLVDADLLQYSELWAAAGTPNTVFAITPAALLRVTRGEVAEIAERPTP
jgi:prolyl-tRNA editing enzyme YbaK/EbsC (Cys-tRNA(Pro) deacylase)